MTLTNRTMAALLIAAFFSVLPLEAVLAQSAVAYNPSARILADMARKGYSETVEDMHVKVLGGYVRVNRTLVGSEWEFNQNWLPVVATSGCGGRKVMRGQYQYDYTVTETVSYQGTDHEADIYAYFTDRRIVAVQDPNQPPPTLISVPSGGSGGGGGPAVGLCVEQPIAYLSLRWEDSFGNWIEYDGSNGRILRYGDRNDIEVSFSYDTNGNMDGVYDHFGTRILTYQYQSYPSQSADRVVSITDSANRQVQYTWSTDGRTLDKTIDVRGEEWLYSYDGSSRLTKVVDPEGRQKLITLGATGGVESVIMAEAGETEGVGTNYTYAFDPTKVEFTTIQRKTGGREESITYDKDGFVIRSDLNGTTLDTQEILNGGRKRVRTKHNGNKITSEYDERNNLIKRTHADGSVITMTYNNFSMPLRAVDEVGTITLYEYDTNGNVEKMTEASGTPDERITEFDYDQFGQMTTIRSLGDASTQLAITTYTYDDYGNVRTETDPTGEVSEWTYDVMGNVLVHTDRRNKLWTNTYDEAGNLRTTTDPLDRLKSYVYDGVGNLILYTDPDMFDTEFEYDARNNLTAIVDEFDGRMEFAFDGNDMPLSSEDADGTVRSATYEANGRSVVSRDGANNEIVFGYGNKSIFSNGGYGQVNSIVFPTFTRNREYDRRGRLKRSIDHLGGGESLETSFEYDLAGRLVSRTNPSGSTMSTYRDALGRVNRVIDDLDDESLTVFDDRDNVISVTDPRGKTIQFEYDLNDRKSAEVKSLGQRTTYGYDAEGNLTRLDDAKDQRIDSDYDDSGQLISESHYRDKANSTPDRVHTFGYNARGLLESWNDSVTSGSRTYDELGRLTSETVDYGAFTLNYILTYNANSTVDTFTDADGTVYRYLYDSDDKPQGIVIPGVGTVAVNEFEWLEPKKVTLPGGTSIDYQYTPLLETAGITVSDAANNTIASHSMSYDAARNLVTENTELGDSTFEYDTVDRLTTATRSVGPDKAYTYDGMGNRLTLDGGTDVWQYDDNNRLLSTGTATYTYDDNGNVASKSENGQTTSFFYDVRNRLERVEDNSGAVVAEYGYDGFSRRVWKQVAGVRTYFFYSHLGLIGEYDATGAVQKNYGYLPGTSWGTNPVYMKAENGYNFYHTDQLGAPYMLTDRNGVITWRAETDPFGASSVSIDTVANNLRFPGQYYDAETELHYNYFRTYNPSTGRYLESDPIGLLGGLNTYAYALQNPLKYIDPYGLDNFFDDLFETVIPDGGFPNETTCRTVLRQACNRARSRCQTFFCGRLGSNTMCVKPCQEPFAQCKVDAGEYCDGQDFGQGDDEPPPPERVYYNDGCYVEWSRTWWGKRKWEWVCPGDEGYVPDPDAEQPCSDE